MGIINKYLKLLGVNEEELRKAINEMPEKDAKDILYFIMSEYNKIRDDVIKII